MARCYYEGKITTRRHVGALVRCARCRNPICEDCVGSNPGQGKVLCFHCAAEVGDMQGREVIGRDNVSNQVIQPQLPNEHIHIPRAMIMGVSNLFLATAAILISTLRLLGRPFHDRRDFRDSTLRLEGDLRWITERQRVLFVSLFALVVFFALIVGFIYANYAQIPTPRFLLALAAACTCWGLLAIYLHYLFAPLQEPVSSVFSYVTAFFLALLFGSWLINLRILDRLLTWVN